MKHVKDKQEKNKKESHTEVMWFNWSINKFQFTSTTEFTI